MRRGPRPFCGRRLRRRFAKSAIGLIPKGSQGLAAGRWPRGNRRPTRTLTGYQKRAGSVTNSAYNALMWRFAGCLLVATQVSVGWSQAFEHDLATALRGSPLAGPAFHRAVLATMAKHKLVASIINNKGGRYLQRTLGDSRGRLLWANRGGFTIDDLYLIWKEGEEVRVQLLARPKNQDWQVFRPGYLRGSELVFCDNAYAGGNWLQPCIRVYKLRKSTWTLTQNLYAAQGKEAKGQLDFVRRNGKVDTTRAEGTVRAYPTFLSAPHVGPLLVYEIRFERVKGTYRQTRDLRRETPLAALEDLARFRAKGMKDSFNRRVPFALRDKLWTLLAPESDLLVSTNSNMVDDESPVLRVAGHELRFVRKTVRWVPQSMVHLSR